MSVSIYLSVSLSVTEVHWRIIANLVVVSNSDPNLPRIAVAVGKPRGACGREGRDLRREEWRDHLALCWPLLGPLVTACEILHRNFFRNYRQATAALAAVCRACVVSDGSAAMLWTVEGGV